jgi:hypothetical protein
MRRLAALLLVACLGSGCLVLNVNPGYDPATVGWEPNLVGDWVDADDNASLQIQRGEWKSYRVHYVHPIETGDLTGYLTMVGNDRFLDLMPMRGEDRGSFLVPVHAFLRLRLDGDRLELSPLSYDWFAPRLKAGAIPGLPAAFDQKENALILADAARFRDWLRVQSADGPVFGPPAVFARKASDAKGHP